MSDQKTFLGEVMQHIKMKEARKLVTAELSSHIEDVKKEWTKKGLSEKEAEEKAVEQMGSPYVIGEKFNKIYRPQVDWVTLALLAAASGLGFLPLITLPDIGQNYVLKHFINVLVGTGTVFAIMIFDYRKWIKNSWIFYCIGIVLLIVMTYGTRLNLPMNFFPTANGVTFIHIGPFYMNSFLPLLSFYIGWASLLEKRYLKIWHFILLYLAPLLLFIMANPSASLLYTAMVFTMVYHSKSKNKRVMLFTGAGIFASAGIVMILRRSRLERLSGFLNPEKTENYQNNYGYISVQIKEILSTSTMFGNGTSIKEIQNGGLEFAFIKLIGHYGFFVAFLAAGVLILLLIRILHLNFSSRDTFGKTLAAGGSALYLGQLFYNLCMSLGWLPIISMPLPFIDYGGSALLVNSVIFGAILSVFRRKHLPPVQP
ncbi:FtsW/RodA/SpoVE family cell cycle protein [Bacillus sp. SJS]|uniref:FtsW/RodA/SpoVE family cell cycle protein n=1 Tax=Bacillus sp. SJS TaxID=1423321 RepID=UPI0004DD00B6|nr:FtsW/RodA/SpoVE family cell cycle protein [Bacillus sp. SJS]KZZ84488.1 hypothetical protein AS29_011590 [Bacillus sp. SJS]